MNITKQPTKEDTLENLTLKLREFVNERDWEQFHTPKNLAIALVVEASELVEKFQWLTDAQSESLGKDDLAEIEEEIGDVVIYITRLADKLGIDPIHAARKKMEKNSQKYPVELVKGKALKYTEYES